MGVLLARGVCSRPGRDQRHQNQGQKPEWNCDQTWLAEGDFGKRGGLIRRVAVDLLKGICTEQDPDHRADQSDKNRGGDPLLGGPFPEQQHDE